MPDPNIRAPSERPHLCSACGPFHQVASLPHNLLQICRSVSVVDDGKKEMALRKYPAAVVIGVSQFDVSSTSFLVIPGVNQPKCQLHGPLRQLQR